MPSGWTQFLLERFGYDFDIVYPAAINAGSLRTKYDVIILPTGAYNERGGRAMDPSMVPAEYRHMVGRLNAEESGAALRQFIEAERPEGAAERGEPFGVGQCSPSLVDRILQTTDLTGIDLDLVKQTYTYGSH